jgi:hypothetical protein
MELRHVVRIIRQEPELPMNSIEDYAALVITWVCFVIMPLRTARAIVKATKQSIERHVREHYDPDGVLEADHV